MDPCCCYICSPCTKGCPKEMQCRSIPPCNLFVDPCHPNDSSVFKSPMCNKKLVKKGAKDCKMMFCVDRRKFAREERISFLTFEPSQRKWNITRPTTKPASNLRHRCSHREENKKFPANIARKKWRNWQFSFKLCPVRSLLNFRAIKILENHKKVSPCLVNR